MQDFFVSFAMIRDILGFLAKDSKNSFGFVSTILKRSCKNLCILPRIIDKILGGNFKNPRHFLARKPRIQALNGLVRVDYDHASFRAQNIASSFARVNKSRSL